MFDEVSFFIGSDDRIGLVGRNGAGKSTLLKILAGQQPFDKGTIGRPKELTLGYLPQEMAMTWNSRPGRWPEKAFEEARDLNASLERIEKDLEKATTDEEAMELATLLAHAHERLNTLGRRRS
jgi:ATP-binding cassette subfamily F protein 3